MPSSISYKAYTKDPKSIWGNPIKWLENRGCKLFMIILIWSISDDLSITCEIFSLQREINEVIDSSGLWPLPQSIQPSPRNINDSVKWKLSQKLLGQIIPSLAAWYIQWSKPTLCHTTQGHREKHNHLGLIQSMSPHNSTIKPQMDARTTNAFVSLNLRHPKLGQETGHWCSIKILSRNSFVWSPHMPQPLLKSIHTCMWVIWGRGRHGDKRQGNLGLTMHSERYNLWC